MRMGKEPEARNRGTKGKILVMDDDETMQEILGHILESLGYASHAARDGAEAITLYTNARESDEPFDVVILDLKIPRGMGGMETIQRLLEIDPEVKAIVSTGYSDETVMTHYQKSGFVGALNKPFKLKELRTLLDRILARG